MNRRDFLKTTVIAGTAFAIPGTSSLFIKTLEAAEKSDIVAAHGLSTAVITKAAIDSRS